MHIENNTFNMHSLIPRKLSPLIKKDLKIFPVVAILGPRQCGKSTLAKMLLPEFANAKYLDLERPSDLRKLRDLEIYFEQNKKNLVCLDEIQRLPEIFPVMRSIVDDNQKNGQLLILGSASRELLKQSSESLAGRISYIYLTPFLFSEIKRKSRKNLLFELWIKGGYPKSYLAKNHEDSYRWRENFVTTLLEKDFPILGANLATGTLYRLWQMLAHSHGQVLNSSKLGGSLGLSHTTIRSYIDFFEKTFQIRVLPPFIPNLKKRIIKSPKVYIKDSGVLHTILEIESIDELLGHPVIGASWEGFVIENILSELLKWKGSFYRTSNGTEIDLILERKNKRIAVECKASSAPQLTKGFWNALEDIEVSMTYIIAPVKEEYLIKRNVKVTSLDKFLMEYA